MVILSQHSFSLRLIVAGKRLDDCYTIVALSGMQRAERRCDASFYVCSWREAQHREETGMLNSDS